MVEQLIFYDCTDVSLDLIEFLMKDTDMYIVITHFLCIHGITELRINHCKKLEGNTCQVLFDYLHINRNIKKIHFISRYNIDKFNLHLIIFPFIADIKSWSSKSPKKYNDRVKYHKIN